MRVLVTGGSGFIGRELLEAFQKNNIDYITIGRSIPQTSENHLYYDFYAENNVQIIRKLNCTHLVHLAWYAEHGEFWESEYNFEWLKITTRLIDEFFRYNGQYAFISGTCAEYDWEEKDPLDHDKKKYVKSTYGIIKDTCRYSIEKISKKYNKKVTWGRLFYPYGKNEKKQRLIPSIINALKKNKQPFEISYNNIRDLTHVRDIASAILLCLNKEYNGTLDLCSGKGIRIKALILCLAELLEEDAKTLLDLKERESYEPKYIIGNNNKLVSMGWEPKVSLNAGLSEYVKGKK